MNKNIIYLPMQSNNSIKFLFLSFFILSSFILAQEFDDAYLESLPEDVRSEVLNQLEEKNKANEPVYKRPNSSIDKDFLGEVDQMQRFGFDIFRTMQTSFMPINEPNFDGSYVLDFGDVLEVQITGQKIFKKDLEIKRDGSINIDDIGKIFVSGLTLNKADDLIRAKASSAYIGVEVYTSLISVRDIQVYIIGEAYQPGLYTLNGNSNPLHALTSAGGLSDNGSFRNIQIKRDGEVISTMDLYDLFIYGNTKNFSRLRSGDVIFIPVAKKLNRIYGGVNRPSEYELLENETLDDLIKYSNGISQNANLGSLVRISRSEGGDFVSDFISNNKFKEIIPKNKESIFIDYFNYKTVAIEGAVKFPGSYTLNINDSLSSLIEKAGGYRDDAYPLGGVLESNFAGDVSQQGSDLAHNKLIEDIFKRNIEITPGLLDILNKLKPKKSNRVIATFDLEKIYFDPSLDTILSDGDKIFIPSKTQQVYVYGAVNSPGTAIFKPDLKVIDYINEKGGFSNSAMEDLIYIVRPNGESQLYVSKGFKPFGISNAQHIIDPGSFIFITPRLNLSSEQNAAIWAPLVSSFALTLASISTLN